MVDAAVSNTAHGNVVWVRVPLRAPPALARSPGAGAPSERQRAAEVALGPDTALSDLANLAFDLEHDALLAGPEPPADA